MLTDKVMMEDLVSKRSLGSPTGLQIATALSLCYYFRETVQLNFIAPTPSTGSVYRFSANYFFFKLSSYTT